MLKAIAENGAGTLAWNAQRGETYRCPECGEVLVLKQGEIIIHHFAHRAESGCGYGTGESLRHMAMKATMARMFEGAEVEIPIVEGRRADVLLPNKIVIECQASAIGTAEWAQRTKDYNRLGYAVLWVWHIERALGCLHDVQGGEWVGTTFRGASYPVPAEVRYCHQQAQGRVYLLDDAGELRCAHLLPGQRWSEKRVEWMPFDGELRVWHGLNGFLFARHRDCDGWWNGNHVGEWFKPSQDRRMERVGSRPMHTPASGGTWWKP